MKRFLGLALGLALVSFAASDRAAVLDGALVGGDSLGPFFDKLEAAGERPGERPLNILQIGDSHSAGDNITGAWRDMLQARYGRGGRGVMPPGAPYNGFHAMGVTVAQSPGWSAESIFERVYREREAHALFGISGFRLTTVSAGATLTLTADSPDFDFDRLIVCAVNGPEAGAYEVTFGGVTTHVDLHAVDDHVACATFQASADQAQAQLTVAAGPVTLTSWGNFRDDGGVTVSNLGVVGAQVSNLGETDDQADQAEFDAYQPDLIVLEFGTNDGFVEHFDPESYEQTLRGTVERVRRLAPGVPILLLGAPDADTNRADLVDNAPAAGPPPPPGTWYPPPGLAAVRQVQREVAAELGVAYWDWSSRMGGPFTAARWAMEDPPLIRKDRVHYTLAGGARVAGLLESDFEAAKAAYILSDR